MTGMADLVADASKWGWTWPIDEPARALMERPWAARQALRTITLERDDFSSAAVKFFPQPNTARLTDVAFRDVLLLFFQ